MASAFEKAVQDDNSMAPAVLALEMATSPLAYDLNNLINHAEVAAAANQTAPPRLRAQELRG